jgi:hypothetical protein
LNGTRDKLPVNARKQAKRAPPPQLAPDQVLNTRIFVPKPMLIAARDKQAKEAWEREKLRRKEENEEMKQANHPATTTKFRAPEKKKPEKVRWSKLLEHQPTQGKRT